MSRGFWVWLHRWVGLAIAGVLVVVALTGSLMAFIQEVDRFLNPNFYDIAMRDAPLLDPLTLRETAEGSDPRFVIDVADLNINRDAPVGFGIGARIDPATGKPFELPYTDIFLDPYTGEKVGARSSLAVTIDRTNVVLFIHDIHTNFALPGSLKESAGTLIGVTAVAWTIDCFVGFFLTLPRRRNGDHLAGKSWFTRWRPAWLIKGRVGAFRLNFDIHRAFGLWTWIALFILAWSGVALSLPQIYNPVMNAIFSAPAAAPERPQVGTPLTPDEAPKIGWREARDRGSALLDEQAQRAGLEIAHETLLVLNREQRRYRMCAAPRDSGDVMHEQQLCVEFATDNGAAIETPEPHEQKKPFVSVVTEWLTSVHMAMLYRPMMQYVVCAMGFIITALSVTGVYIWWKKRAARKRREAAVIEPAREATQP
jgi:uncharacterized iron-regulated membrane protein